MITSAGIGWYPRPCGLRAIDGRVATPRTLRLLPAASPRWLRGAASTPLLRRVWYPLFPQALAGIAVAATATGRGGFGPLVLFRNADSEQG